MYRFDLLNSSDMSAIAQLSARSRSFDLTLNRPGSAKFLLSLTDVMADYVQPVSTAIRIVRDNVVLWSGPVWSLNSDAANETLEVGCVGWLELLNYRVLRDKVTYTAQQDVNIIDAVLAIVNSQTDGTTTRPSWVVDGVTISGSFQNRTRTYEAGQKVWPLLQELSDVESGCDFVVNPTTRVLEFYGPLGSDRPDVKFGYNTWPNNLLNATESYDTPRTVNRLNVKGKIGSAMAQDTAAMDELGQMFEDNLALTDVTDVNILTAYAGAEVVYRATPLRQFTILPEPYHADAGVPQPFVDYGLGDTVYFSVDKGRMQVSNQAVRVFGLSVSVDDEDNETIAGMRVSA